MNLARHTPILSEHEVGVTRRSQAIPYAMANSCPAVSGHSPLLPYGAGVVSATPTATVWRRL